MLRRRLLRYYLGGANCTGIRDAGPCTAFLEGFTLAECKDGVDPIRPGSRLALDESGREETSRLRAHAILKEPR